MSQPINRRSYPTPTAKSSSPLLDDYKKRTSLLKDNSWIRRDPEEDEPVDRDPNPGRAILSRYRTNETATSPEPADTQRPKPTSNLASVQSLTKRFSASQDDLNKSSSLPAYGRPTLYSTKSTSSLRSTDEPKTTTVTKTVKEEPKTSTKTTTITKDGKTTETTTITSTGSVVKTPAKTETFTERVFSDVKSPSKGMGATGQMCEKPDVRVTTRKTTEDQLFDTLIPTSIKTELLTPESPKTVSKTETVTVKTSKDGPYGDTTKTTTRTSSTTEDKLFDTLLPTALKSGYSYPDSTSTTTITKREIVTVDSAKGDNTKTVTVTSPTSPTKTSTSFSSYSSSDDSSLCRTPSYSGSTKPRTVLEKDLCSYCRKPMSSDPKMVLEDMNINCHATCFKCEVCNSYLGNLKAGDSLWIYRRSVHCEGCFDITREKWRR